MKILFTSDPEVAVPPKLYGGIQRVLAELILYLDAAGHSIALVAHPESHVKNAALYAWPGQQSQHVFDTIKNTYCLHCALREFKPDIIHSFARLLYLLPVLPMKIPKLMSYQREPSKRTTSMALKLAKNLSFTGCSDYICSLGKRVGGKWHTIHNFINLKTYDYVPQVKEDAPLVFLSRLDRVKGADIAIRIAKQCGKKLILAGNHASAGPEARYFESQIKPQIDNDQIRYVGAVNDQQKNELLGQAAAMIVPIQWDEPFGIVFIESLACGTPVITSTRGATPEIIRPGVDGYLADNDAALIEAVNSLQNIERKKCRNRVEANFTRDVVCRKYLDLYRELLANEESSDH